MGMVAALWRHCGGFRFNKYLRNNFLLVRFSVRRSGSLYGSLNLENVVSELGSELQTASGLGFGGYNEQGRLRRSPDVPMRWLGEAGLNQYDSGR
jgi:hypothetical protein